MRVEVYEENADADEFLFGSYSGDNVDVVMDEAKLRKVQDVLSKQHDYVASLLKKFLPAISYADNGPGFKTTQLSGRRK